IGQYNQAAAGRVVALIEKIAARLGEFPESGQRSDELDARVVYSARYPYRLYYRIASDEIVILHIRHTARRPVQANEI
ncbi:MAG: type II toxin-antitoxin system RelE/ParE family toxin, partial [Candidatus Eiseniibacteriota bacterium]